MKDEIIKLRNDVHELRDLIKDKLWWLAYNSVDVFKDVEALHQHFKIDYNGPPRHLPPDLSLFRTKFIEEEYDELMHKATSDEERIDGICDLMYVLIGYAYLRGWDLRKAWSRVHNANMAKELRSPENPGIREVSHAIDLVKPAGWIAPNHSDLVRIPEKLEIASAGCGDREIGYQVEGGAS